MMETIEVGYSVAAGVGVLGIYHKYILYTDSDGNQFVARGGPTTLGAVVQGGGLKEFSKSIFGNITTVVEPYTDKSRDWDSARDPANTDPNAKPHVRELIKQGSDLSAEWAKITETINDIDKRNIPYNPFTCNSNATVDEALREAGLPAPTMDDPGENWSPGSDYDLPGGSVPSTAPSISSQLGGWFVDKLKDAGDKLKSIFGFAKSGVSGSSSVALDLDGNALETTRIAAISQALADQDGSKTGAGSDTLSLGGDIADADPSVAKSGKDTTPSDKIAFRDWFAATPSKSVANLPVITEAMDDFAFGGGKLLKGQSEAGSGFAGGLVGALGVAHAAYSGLSSWALSNALTSFHLAGADTAALGSDLAEQHGKIGVLAGVGGSAAVQTLSNVALSSSAQMRTPFAGLHIGSLHLS